MSSPLKVAVIGVGSLGKEHARIYASLAAAGKVELAGVFDAQAESAASIAHKLGTRAFTSIEEAAAVAEALSIVTPTVTHFAIARELLAQGKHLLVEKPMTETAAQAAELVELAQRHAAVLQVGHVERFNPTFKYMTEVAREPKFIEAHRLSPYPARSTDIGVVLDLMIHDLDVVLAFVNSPVQSVDAVGMAVLSSTEDIANARLRFANGCVANLTASRVSAERMRKVRVFSAGETPVYVSLEGESESSLFKKLLLAKDSTIVSEFAGKRIVREPVPIQKDEPLKLELEHFVECVNARQRPLVSGESAKQALDLALEITKQIQDSGMGKAHTQG
jgi:predicted dehydrogenase